MTDNKTALCFIDGNKGYLVPSNSDFPIIEATDDNEVMLWGVVTYWIKKH